MCLWRSIIAQENCSKELERMNRFGGKELRLEGYVSNT